jgi:hypothetical protein
MTSPLEIAISYIAFDPKALDDGGAA